MNKSKIALVSVPIKVANFCLALFLTQHLTAQTNSTQSSVFDPSIQTSVSVPESEIRAERARASQEVIREGNDLDADQIDRTVLNLFAALLQRDDGYLDGVITFTPQEKIDVGNVLESLNVESRQAQARQMTAMCNAWKEGVSSLDGASASDNALAAYQVQADAERDTLGLRYRGAIEEIRALLAQESLQGFDRFLAKMREDMQRAAVLSFPDGITALGGDIHTTIEYHCSR